MTNGALFAVPIPHEYETVGLKLQKAVEQTLEEAERQVRDHRIQLRCVLGQDAG